jgi:hypothetical protein
MFVDAEVIVESSLEDALFMESRSSEDLRSEHTDLGAWLRPSNGSQSTSRGAASLPLAHYVHLVIAMSDMRWTEGRAWNGDSAIRGLLNTRKISTGSFRRKQGNLDAWTIRGQWGSFDAQTDSTHYLSTTVTMVHPASTKTYAARAGSQANPAAKRLLELMDRKQTNLCVSVDVTTTAEVLEIVKAVGPSVCMVKVSEDTQPGYHS